MTRLNPRHTLLALALCLTAPWAHAHGDEVHDSPSPAPAAAPSAPRNPAAASLALRPQRLPDGRVWLDKASQRRLGIRTQLSMLGEHRPSVELNGHVVMDPNAGGRVQASLSGALEAGPDGLPSAGQRVRQGQLLAYLRPSLSAGERASQQAELAELHIKAAQAARQLARLESLRETVAARDIDAQRAEAASLRQRAAALATAGGRLALRAPASGVLSQANALNGQQVEAGALLFEVVDPQKLRVEALAHDPAMAQQLGRASLPGSATPWQLVGSATAFRDGALPLLFAPQGRQDVPLALGQSVKLRVAYGAPVSGVALPAASVQRNSANQPVVWLHDSAELFRPWPVQIAPLNGQDVLVRDLPAGRRVVSAGAALLNQIR